MSVWMDFATPESLAKKDILTKLRIKGVNVCAYDSLHITCDAVAFDIHNLYSHFAYSGSEIDCTIHSHDICCVKSVRVIGK